MLYKSSIKNINVELILLGFDRLDKFQKLFNSIIASMEIVSNHYI